MSVFWVPQFFARLLHDVLEDAKNSRTEELDSTNLVSSTLPFEQRETKLVNPMPISFSW